MLIANFKHTYLILKNFSFVQINEEIKFYMRDFVNFIYAILVCKCITRARRKSNLKNDPDMTFYHRLI